MRFKAFSPKQLTAMSWWCDSSRYHSCDAIICDGAVRSGKTLCMSISFILWSMLRFDGQGFGICGKTVTSLRRNVIAPLLPVFEALNICCVYKVSSGMLELSYYGRRNRYYLFGGRDEGSSALIQGITLAGVLLDEVALMPRSFVEQALARCSVEGSRFWFNCNPDHPHHWFYTEWIQKAREKNACYLHFKMNDNPSLSAAVLMRYEKLYSGVFYERYVLGKWVAAHGAVYPMFSSEAHVVDTIPALERYVISCDYGTVNPASFGLWGFHSGSGAWYRVREYYHDSRREGMQKTDEEYRRALVELAAGLPLEAVVVDPSAASFIQCLRQGGDFAVVPARNDVLDGIRVVSGMLREGKLLFHRSCADSIREFSLYRWDTNSARDMPKKENDHAMDDIRYFAAYINGGAETGFHAVSAERAL